MTEETPGYIAPRLSGEAIADYRRILADRKFEEEAPERYAILKTTFEEALRVTGQDKPPPSDGRSPQQIAHDQALGVNFAGRPQLPEHLSAVIAREVAADAPTKDVVERHLGRVGLDYKETVEAAQAALDRTGSPFKATELSAHSLSQLVIYGQFLKRHSDTRPG
jgi:hypothetical protein